MGSANLSKVALSPWLAACTSRDSQLPPSPLQPGRYLLGHPFDSHNIDFTHPGFPTRNYRSATLSLIWLEEYSYVNQLTTSDKHYRSLIPIILLSAMEEESCATT